MMYHARYEKPLKNHSLFVAKKSVETYSPSNAVALVLEEEVLLKHPSKTKTRKKEKRNSTGED